MATPAAPLPTLKLSSAALLGIAAIVGLMAAGIFGYILFLAPAMSTDSRLWWTGFVSYIFAFIGYLVYAGTEARLLRNLSGGLFLVGTGAYYGAIFANPGLSTFMQLTWAIVLSVIVVLVLIGVFMMAREAEATAVRAAQRRLTP